MTGYNIVNLSDIVNHLGEVDTKKILDGFSCPLNADVEYFLKHKAIEFSRQSLSKTHLVYTSYKGEPVLIGYFTLCSKVITIKKNILSRTLQKRIRKFSQNNSDNTELLVTANLIAQIGKNFSDEYDSLITGDELLQIALNVLASVQGMVTHDRKTITVEFKIKDWRHALEQVRSHGLGADRAYICPLRSTLIKLMHLLRYCLRKRVLCKLNIPDYETASIRVFNRMKDSFESWFPIDASDTEEEIEMYREGFARAKLSLELGIMRSTVRRSGFLWWLCVNFS